MSFFNLKLAILGSTFFDPFLKSDKIHCIDKKISEKINDFEYDLEEVSKLRLNTRNNILKLNRLMKKVNSRNLPSYENTSLKEIRIYEKSLRKQQKDILQIILLLKNLIENEYLEIIYDIRGPFKLVEHFIKKFKKITFGLAVKKSIGNEIKKIFDEIESSYSNLLDYTFKFIESDFKYYNNIGLNFRSFDNSLETDYALSTHLKNRSRIKQQINGKTQWIKSRINRLEDIFKVFLKKGIVDKNQTKVFLQTVNYFKEQLEGLVLFCIKRVDVANHMIIEAIVIQKDKYAELEELRKESKQFYSEFIQEQEKLLSRTESKWITKQTEKRILEFKNYKKEMEKEFSEFEKEFTIAIDKVEKEDIKDLQLEKEELKKVEGFFKRFKRNFKRGVAIGMLGLTLVGYSVPSSSIVGTTRDAIFNWFSHPLYQSEIIKDLIISDIDEIQKEIYSINDKLNNGENLSQKDITFLRSIYNIISSGGIYKKYYEASILLNNYLKATGKPIELNPEVYKESKVVRNAIKIVEKYFSDLYEAGKIKEGDSGKIDLGKILKKGVFPGGIKKGGKVLDNGYLLAEQDNLRLKNTDNRFKLECEYSIKNGKVYFKWEINSVYDFENNPNHVTHIPLPGSNKVLKIPDQLSYNLVKIGLAKEFKYYTSWTSSYDLTPLASSK